MPSVGVDQGRKPAVAFSSWHPAHKSGAEPVSGWILRAERRLMAAVPFDPDKL